MLCSENMKSRSDRNLGVILTKQRTLSCFLQLMHAAVPLGALPYPRQLLKRGALQKRGRSGVFHDRFVVSQHRYDQSQGSC